ncbi:MAG: sigma-70 family RNA polymerase sigma factor [Acidobacteriota bacterium]
MDYPESELRGVYDAYHERVRNFASKLIGRDSADDIAQEVFIRITQHLENLKDPSKLTSWIYAITLNVVRDTMRNRAARGEGTAVCAVAGEPDEKMERLPDRTSRSAEEIAIRKEMLECYLNYVEQLPDHYYEVYALSELEDLSNQEIADRLSLSLDTVKIRLHRARTKLYEELRQNCRCYYNERGELMGEPKRDPPAPPGSTARDR